MSESLYPVDGDIARLPRAHGTAFAAGVSERLLPNYAAFSRQANWGDVRALRSALDRVWAHLEGATMPEAEIRALMRSCKTLIPDMDEFTNDYVTGAQEAAMAVVLTLDSLLPGDRQDPLRVSRFAFDTVDEYVQAVEDLDPNDDDLEETIERHPLMVRELDLQRRALERLLRTPALDRETLSFLRTLFENSGRSNIDQG